MRKRELGRTGHPVSEICLGTMYFGTKVDRDMAFHLLDQYVEAGGSFLDTANKYACWVDGAVGGESETLLGDWMRQRSNRARMFVATKMGFEHPPDVPTGLRADLIEQECNKSLERLGTNTIDLYYAHCDDRETPMEEVLGAFQRLIEAGKVRYLGASNFTAWRLAEALQTSKATGGPAYCCIQQAHTYIRPPVGAWNPGREAGPELNDFCRSRDLTLLAYCPLRQGCYTRSDRPVPWPGEDTRARLSALTTVARATNVTENQVVLAWMRQSDPPVVPVMAASNPDQMTENLASCDLELSRADLARLDEPSA